MGKLASLTLVVLLIGAASIGCGKKPEAAPSESGSVAASGSELERLQGVWAVDSVDTGDPKDSDQDRNEKLRFQFQGNRLNIIMEKKYWERSSFTLQENSDPKAMVLTPLDDKGDPMKPFVSVSDPKAKNANAPDPVKKESIYKFEGDLLVLAMSASDEAPRPTEFKARAGVRKPGSFKYEVYPIAVAKLKKTNEPPATDPGPVKFDFVRPGTARSSK